MVDQTYLINFKDRLVIPIDNGVSDLPVETLIPVLSIEHDDGSARGLVFSQENASLRARECGREPVRAREREGLDRVCRARVLSAD